MTYAGTDLADRACGQEQASETRIELTRIAKHRQQHTEARGDERHRHHNRCLQRSGTTCVENPHYGEPEHE